MSSVRCVGCLHFWAIPLESFAYSQSDAAEKNNFGEISCDFELRIGRGSAFASGNPFQVLFRIGITGQVIAGQSDWYRLERFMFLAVLELFLIIQLYKEARAIIVR